MSFALATIVAVTALTAAGMSAARGPGDAGSPLAGHLLPAPTRFEGRVLERLEAGSYAYLRIARDGSPDAWIVAVRPRPRPGDRVHVDALGRAERFHSARLGRDFSGLFFATVRAAD
jgi:hypothetical protein